MTTIATTSREPSTVTLEGKAKIEQLVEQRIAVLAADGGDQAMFAEQQQSVLEQLFIEQSQTGDPELALEELKTAHTTMSEPADDEDPQEQFDAPAYSNELRRRLVELQPVTDAELDALALERRNRMQAAVLAVNPELQNRTRVGEPQDVDSDEEKGIRMKVTLTADSSE